MRIVGHLLATGYCMSLHLVFTAVLAAAVAGGATPLVAYVATRSAPP